MRGSIVKTTAIAMSLGLSLGYMLGFAGGILTQHSKSFFWLSLASLALATIVINLPVHLPGKENSSEN